MSDINFSSGVVTIPNFDSALGTSIKKGQRVKIESTGTTYVVLRNAGGAELLKNIRERDLIETASEVGSGDMLGANNLSDVANAATARTNLDVYSTSEVDGKVVGLYDHKGAYDASTNTPDLDTAPSGIKKGDAYTVSVAGTFFTEALEAGDVIIADIDDPTVLTDWTRVNKNFSFGTTAGTAAEGNDSRLSDARTPTAHAASHTDGTDDIQNATVSQKGLMTTSQVGDLANSVKLGETAQFSSIAEKTAVASDDRILIESNADFEQKRFIQVTNLPTKTHATSHTDGTDDIQDATNAQKGLATASQITRLEDALTKGDTSQIAGLTLDQDLNSGSGLFIWEDGVTGELKQLGYSDIQQHLTDLVNTQVAAQFTQLSQKTAPISGDYLLAEDSENADNKVYLTIQDLIKGLDGTSLPTADPVEAGKLWVDSADGYTIKVSQG